MDSCLFHSRSSRLKSLTVVRGSMKTDNNEGVSDKKLKRESFEFWSKNSTTKTMVVTRTPQRGEERMRGNPNCLTGDETMGIPNSDELRNIKLDKSKTATDKSNQSQAEAELRPF